MTERLSPPPEVLEIASRLEEAGHEAWFVGGAVRDALLGHPHLDWDLATSAVPADVQKLFKRTIPVGIEFGTVGVLDRRGRMHEVTTFRRDIKTDGRHAEVEFGASLEDDLARRDLTINAIAYSASRKEVRDPFGGVLDLGARIVRAVGDPDARMREDRLRALRAIRFASRFEFDLDDATWRAVVNSAPHLGRLSAERVQQEIDKTLEQVRRPSVAFGRWIDSGTMAALLPTAAAAMQRESLDALDCVPPPSEARPGRRELRLALLLLDLQPRDARKQLRALRVANTRAEWVAAIVNRWHSLRDEMLRVATAPASARDVRRLVAAMGRTYAAPVLRVAAARWSAARAAGDPAPAARDVASVYRRAIKAAYGEPIELADLAVDGDDLITAGIAPGPSLGKILHRLLEAVIEDPARNTRDGLLDLAREASDKPT